MNKELIRRYLIERLENIIFDYVELELSKTDNNEWVPFTLEYDDDEERYILQCKLPDDGQEILVTDEETVWQDVFLRDGEDCYLDGGGAFCDEVSAWRPMPEPYREVRND